MSDARRESSSQGEELFVERRDGSVVLRLLDAGLWQAFRQQGTEMIITKAGRRMFPFVMVTIEGLSPTLLYSVHLSLEPCDNRQYKFCQRRWISVSDAAPGPTPIPPNAYTHPASPNRGSFWCQEMISFAKLKITNNKHSAGDIVLQSMRKYMAKITVREDLGDKEYVFPLPETTFVAVTQYQNEAITRMKIAHNPFANGFKYAHVTQTDDTKKVLPRTVSKQKHGDYSKDKDTVTKTARVKATVTPQTVTPPGPATSPQQPASAALGLSADCLLGAVHPPVFPPPPSHSSLLGNYPVITTATVSPFVFQPSPQGSPPPHFISASKRDSGEVKKEETPRTGEDSETTKRNNRDSESPTVTSEPSSPNTSAGPTGPADVLGELDGQASSTKDEDATDTHSDTAAPFDEEGDTSFGPGPKSAAPDGEPLRNGSSKKVTCRKSGTTGGMNASTDTDLAWYRNALRQAALRENTVIRCDRGVQLTLHDMHAWRQFSASGARMTISKEGKIMNPAVTLSFRGLDPARLYSVWLHLTSAEDQGGMFGSLYPFQRDLPSVRPCMHPFSPMRGLAWMHDKISFNDVMFTSNLASDDPACLPLVPERRYIAQVVVREEEEVTAGSPAYVGDLMFFPLPEVTFTTVCDGEDSKELASSSISASDEEQSLKRKRQVPPIGANVGADVLDGGLEDPLARLAKHMRLDPAAAQLGTADLLNQIRAGSDPALRLNQFPYYMPPVPTVTPAHVGLPPSRIPGLCAPLQALASYPFHPLLQQLRNPLQTAFNMASFPGIHPFSFLCYPYGLPGLPPSVSVSQAEGGSGLDLSLKAGRESV